MQISITILKVLREIWDLSYLAPSYGSVVAGGAVARGRLHLLVVVDVLGHLPDLKIVKHEAFVSTG